MLLDMPRLEETIDRRFPPHDGLPLTQRIERALWGYVKGQTILSTRDRRRAPASACGSSARPASWRAPSATRSCSALWTAFIEVIPYIGPWLSAVPPAIYALFVDPVGVIWVALLFLFIYQVEGHVVVPNVMASALRLHPLMVIFGLLAGGALYGIPGVLVALPTMAGDARDLGVLRRARRTSSAGTRGGTVPVARRGAGEEPPLEPPRVVSRTAAADRSRLHRRTRGVTLPFAPWRASRSPACGACGAPTRCARSCARRALARRRRDAAVRLPGRGRRAAGRGLDRDRAALGGRARARGERSCSGSGSGRCCSSASRRRRTRRARARGTTTASCSARCGPLSAEAPGLTLLTDVCLCEYTAHGHCGVLRDGEVANDATLELLARTAVSHVEAGADVVAPSDMMDGRVGGDPRRAARDADRRLRGEVRLGVLRPVPRGGGVGAGVRRPARLPDGPGQRPRGAARVRARPRGGRRHADGQAGAPVPRRDPGGARALRLPGRGRTTSPASTRW